jgi:hypothetical protein
MLRVPVRVAILALAMLSVSTMCLAATIGYTLDVETDYCFCIPGGSLFLGGGAPSPDTGSFSITNNGTTTFTGMIGDVAHSGAGPDFSFTSGALTLAPGASVRIAVGPESSNFGGFNGPTGSTQPGVEIVLSGLIDGLEPVALSVFDRDIHSGVPRVNPFGLVVDSYVLQGGEPLGRDTGDAFETTQAPGHFEFFEAGSTSVIPEPGSLMLLGTGLVGLGRRALRRKTA